MYIGSHRKLVITGLLLVIATGAIVYTSFIFQTSKGDVPESTTKTLPNTLLETQASIEKISLNGLSFLVASSIHPVLRPGAEASAETIAVKDGWTNQFAGVMGNVSHMYPGSDLLSLRRDGTRLYLDRINIKTKNNLPSIVLGILSDSTNTDESRTVDEVKDFSINTDTRTISYVIRRKILYNDPIGIVQPDSTAEIWSFTYPDQPPQKITTLQPLDIGKSLASNTEEYDLPEQAYLQQGQFVLQYGAGLAQFNPATKKLIMIDTEGWNSFIRYSASPTGKYGVLYVYRDHSTSEKTAYENHIYVLDTTFALKEVAYPVDDTVSTMSWSPQEDFVVLGFNLGEIASVNIGIKQLKQLKLPQTTSGRVVDLYDVLSENTILIGKQDANGQLDEVPTYDPNGLTQMVVWNYSSNTLTQVGNYRTPQYIGPVQ
ncbi:MAG: hypothetical protein AAB402_04450 [Patescibacteria group bacterium]